MILPSGLPVLVTPLQLPNLFAEPMGFLAVWLLFGWLLLHFSWQSPAPEDPAVIEHRDNEWAADARRRRDFELVVLGVSLYVLLRYCPAAELARQARYTSFPEKSLRYLSERGSGVDDFRRLH